MRSLSLLFILFSLAVPRLDAAAPEVGFLLFGDFGTGTEDQKSVARGMKTYCEIHLCQFVAGLGDNFYPAGVRSVNDSQWKTKFEKIYEALDLPFYPALGNHDYYGNAASQVEYSKHSKYWKMPSRYYSYTRGPVTFFVLDTNRYDSIQSKWLASEMKKTASPWVIVYGHHPIYSYGEHGQNGKLIKVLLPLLEDQADLYLSGHDHDKQLLVAKSGFPMVVSGAAAQTRPTSEGSLTLFARSSLGFSHLEISGDSAVLRIADKNGDVEFERVLPKRKHKK